MKIFRILLLPVLFFILVSFSFAQEHFTEGNVRAVYQYRTAPGKFDDYMKYLRENFLPTQEEAKKQGLIVDYSVLINNNPNSPDDPDVSIVYIYKSYGDALDYNQVNEDKMKEIQANHYKTKDESKINEMTSKRFEMRKFIGVRFLREVTLKPLSSDEAKK